MPSPGSDCREAEACRPPSQRGPCERLGSSRWSLPRGASAQATAKSSSSTPSTVRKKHRSFSPPTGSNAFARLARFGLSPREKPGCRTCDGGRPPFRPLLMVCSLQILMLLLQAITRTTAFRSRHRYDPFKPASAVPISSFLCAAACENSLRDCRCSSPRAERPDDALLCLVCFSREMLSQCLPADLLWLVFHCMPGTLSLFFRFPAASLPTCTKPCRDRGPAQLSRRQPLGRTANCVAGNTMSLLIFWSGSLCGCCERRDFPS